MKISIKKLSFVCLGLFFVLTSFFVGANLGRLSVEFKGENKFWKLFNHVSDFKRNYSIVSKIVISFISGDPYLLLRKIDSNPDRYINKNFPNISDSGYLLVSGVSSEYKKSVVRLIRIRDGEVLAVWEPDWNYVFKNLKQNKFSDILTVENARAINPILLRDGSIIFNTSLSMVKMNLCSKKPDWVLDHPFHHSIDLDENGNIWAPSIFGDGKGLSNIYRNDSIAEISNDGRLIKEIPFIDVLIKNGLRANLFGMQGNSFNNDPIHINQITVAKYDSDYWNKGDVLISSRHLSTIFLFRPSTGKIVWHKTGPWLNQHSALFLDDAKISVFNNNVFTFNMSGPDFQNESDYSDVMIYDFKNDVVTRPYSNFLKDGLVRSRTQGRAQILRDGSLFLEETDAGRMIKITKDGIAWIYSNKYNQKYIGDLAWSRYIEYDDIPNIFKDVGKLCN